MQTSFASFYINFKLLQIHVLQTDVYLEFNFNDEKCITTPMIPSQTNPKVRRTQKKTLFFFKFFEFL